MCELMSGLQSISIELHVCFMAIPCDFYYYSSVGELEIKDGDTSGSCFIVQDCFSFPELFGCLCILVGVSIAAVKHHGKKVS